jgi:hypothetical protein
MRRQGQCNGRADYRMHYTRWPFHGNPYLIVVLALGLLMSHPSCARSSSKAHVRQEKRGKLVTAKWPLFLTSHLTRFTLVLPTLYPIYIILTHVVLSDEFFLSNSQAGFPPPTCPQRDLTFPLCSDCTNLRSNLSFKGCLRLGLAERNTCVLKTKLRSWVVIHHGYSIQPVVFSTPCAVLSPRRRRAIKA